MRTTAENAADARVERLVQARISVARQAGAFAGIVVAVPLTFIVGWWALLLAPILFLAAIVEGVVAVVRASRAEGEGCAS